MQTTSRFGTLFPSLFGLLVVMACVLAVNLYTARADANINASTLALDELSDSTYSLAFSLQGLHRAQNPANVQALKNTINANQANIDELYNLMAHGGEYTLYIDQGRTQSLKVPAFSSALLATLDDSKTLWLEFRRHATGAISPSATSEIQQAAADYTLAHHKTLYLSLNEAYELLNVHQKRLMWLDRISTLIGFLSLLGFMGWFLGHYRRQVAKKEAQIIQAQEDTKDILKTVSEGLFLMDEHLVIGAQYSDQLETILQTKAIAGRTLVEILGGMISAKDLETTQMFVEQLYNPWVVEDLIGDLNPLRGVRVRFTDLAGNGENRYLNFDFSRVLNDEDEVTRIFVSVVDVTEEVLLKRQIETARTQHDRQIEMISYIIGVNPEHLVAFIGNAFSRIETMNDILRGSGAGMESLHNRARHLFREIHSLKGEASAVAMSAFVGLCEQAEERLSLILDKKHITGNDFLAFTILLNDLFELTNFIGDLARKLNLMQAPTPSLASKWVRYFENFAQQVAMRAGKTVDVSLTGLDAVNLDTKDNQYLKDVLMQLIKNAIVHGIETPRERLELGKEEVGKVRICLDGSAGYLVLHAIDDGAGIDFDALRNKARENGMSVQEAGALSVDELYQLMMRSGVSTRSHVQDEDAGRGVGMDVVRQAVLDKGGQIAIESNPNQGTEFILTFKEAICTNS